jgi:hypothetical protein
MRVIESENIGAGGNFGDGLLPGMIYKGEQTAVAVISWRVWRQSMTESG